MKVRLFLWIVLLSALIGCTNRNRTVSVDSFSDSSPVLDGSDDVLSDEGSVLTSSFHGVDISFTYQRSSTLASNQVALWIEDDKGTLIRTLYVSNFTAKGGYKYREDTLSNWVSLSDVSSMSDSEVAVFSLASLSSGKKEFSWDGLDSDGKKVSSGIYTLKIEGTLYPKLLSTHTHN